LSEQYYKPCKELTRCDELIEKYYLKEDYKTCFEGHLELAKIGYPLAECQVGYFYLEGIGVEKDLEQAFYWTEQAAIHGDRDGQYNLAMFLEEGTCGKKDLDLAKEWYLKAARQDHDLARKKCHALGL